MGRLCGSCLENLIMSGALTFIIVAIRMLVLKRK